MKEAARTTLRSPFADTKNAELSSVSVYIPDDVRNYFIRATGASKGAVNSILATLLKSFYDECNRLTIPARFELDNEDRLRNALASVRFGSNVAEPPAKRARARRTTASLAVAAHQPNGCNDEHATAD